MMTDPKTNPDTDSESLDEQVLTDEVVEQAPGTDEMVDATGNDTETMTPSDIESHLTSDACDEDSRRCIEQLIQEVIEASESRQRALADFKNFQRRSAEHEQRMTRIASAEAYRSVLPVLDQLRLALDQDSTAASGEQILAGVRIAGDELEKVLSDHGIDRIEPQSGDEFDPIRHEAMMNIESTGVDSGRIVEVLQAGFVFGEHVLRPAKVTIAT
jgi:molecular chaperone GrpE